MRPRRARAGAVAAALGALLFVLTNVPPEWFGATTGDSYVFQPPVFTPLWVERVVMPPLSVVAIVALAVGLGVLVGRDWPVGGRLRQGGGVVAVTGVGLLAVALGLLQSIDGAGPLSGVVGALGGLAVGLLGLLLAVPALLALGFGYTRTDRPTVGYALIAVVPLGLVMGVVLPEFAGAIPMALLVAAVWGVVAHELWHHPEPLDGSSEGDGGDEPSTEGTATGDRWTGDDAG